MEKNQNPGLGIDGPPVYPYSQQDSQVSDAMYSAIQLVKSKGLSQDFILILYAGIQAVKHGKIDKLSNYQEIRMDSAAFVLNSDELSELCEKVQPLLEDMAALDFLEQMYSAEIQAQDDSGVICGYFYQHFIEKSLDLDDLFLVDVPPFLIRKILRDPRIAGKNVHVCCYESMLITIGEADPELSKFHWIPTSYLCGARINAGILVCADRQDPVRFDDTIKIIQEISSMPHSLCHVLIPELYISAKPGGKATKESLASVGIYGIHHVEKKIFNRKVRTYSSLELGSIKEAPERVPVQSIQLLKETDSVALTPIDVGTITQAELFKSGKTVAEIVYEMKYPPKEEIIGRKNGWEQRNIFFCKEFQGSATVSKTGSGAYRVSLSVYKAPTEKQLKRNRGAHGEKIGKTVKGKSFHSPQEALQSVYELAFHHKDLRKAIMHAFPAAPGCDDSLYLVWYRKSESLMKKSAAVQKTAIEIFCRPTELRERACKISLESSRSDLVSFADWVKSSCTKTIAESIFKCIWTICCRVDLDIPGLTDRFACFENRAESRSKAHMAALRSALVQSTFAEKLLFDLWKKCESFLKSDRYGLAVGALLRLGAGMKISEITALKNLQVEMVGTGSGDKHARITITHECVGPKGHLRSIKSQTQRRVIEVSALLTEILQEWSSYRTLISTPSDCYLVIEKDGEWVGVKPDDLKDFCKKLENDMIKSPIYIEIVDENGIRKEIDITHFQGDLWRNSFELCAKRLGQMPMGHINSYLGRKDSKVTETHYTNFLGRNRRRECAAEIDRIGYKIRNCGVPVSYQFFQKDIITARKKSAILDPVSVPIVDRFMVQVPANSGQVKIIFTCPHGMTIAVESE